MGDWIVRRHPEGLVEVLHSGDRSSVMFSGLRIALVYLFDRLTWGDRILTQEVSDPPSGD